MKLRTVLLLLVIIIVLVVIKFLFFKPVQTNGKGPQQGMQTVSNVSAYVIKNERIDNVIYASGTILANEEVQIQPELSGKIIQLNFKEGAKVVKGQLLAKINDADLQAQYRKLQLQYALANEKLQRQKQLLAVGGASQQDYDISQNEYNVIKADIDYAAAQIEKTEIKAPFNGMIGLKNISEGAYATPSTVIARIQQIDPIKIDFAIPERYATVVKKGNKVIFSIEGNKEKLIGEVFAVEPKIDMATRTLQVRAICPNKNGNIFPGAFARVELALEDVENALMVPTEAVIPDLRGKKVFRIRNNLAESVRIETGLRTESNVQVTKGLNAGDTIVTTGIMQLKPKSQVRIIEVK